MSEPEEEKEEKKKITVGKTLTVSYSADVILLRIASEAQRKLDKLAKKVKRLVMQRAIELSKKKGREYDVRLEDVIEAKAELKLEKGEGD